MRITINMKKELIKIRIKFEIKIKYDRRVKKKKLTN